MITMYTKNNCGYCQMAKGLLNNRDMEYTEINVEESREAMEFLQHQGHRTMPQFYQDGELFVEGGFQGLKDHLDKENIDTTQLGTI